MSTMSAAPGYMSTPNATILVTGSSGFVGARLVEILLERQAKKVLCFDIVPPSPSLLERFEKAANFDKSRLAIFSGPEHGNLTLSKSVNAAFASEPKIDVVYHIAALVGPYHNHDAYKALNYDGSMHILTACLQNSTPRLVYSSSPSTRFTGAHVKGLREDQMPIPSRFLAAYAETKAMAEQKIRQAANPKDGFYTVAVAPHQVYGPHDPLFFPALLETAGSGKLRIFGEGANRVSVCFVDNYCHGLICGADALNGVQSDAVGNYYVITDDGDQFFWKFLNKAVMAMGFTDLESKFHLPTAFLMMLAYAANVLGWVLGRKFKLNPFSVKMLTIHRYFSIENAKRDLNYVPLYDTTKALDLTIDWFKKNWLPGYLVRRKAGKGSAVIGKKDD